MLTKTTTKSKISFYPLFVTATFQEILTDTQTKTAKTYLLELCKL